MKHELFITSGARGGIVSGHCGVCGLVWHGRRGVLSAEEGFCYGVPAYEHQQVPANLFSVTELKALGLKPTAPAVASIYMMNRNRSWLLYDKANTVAIVKRDKS